MVGLYEELREVTKIKRILTGDMVRTKNQITNWFDRYFPEYINNGIRKHFYG